MQPIPIPDLTTYGAGGVTLGFALYVVLQALKRNHPGLQRWMPVTVIAMASGLVASLMWMPQLFAWLAGTVLLAAGVMLTHGGVKQMAKKPEEP